MDKTIEDLEKRKEELLAEVRTIDTALNSLRELCSHPKWEDLGHDSHHEHRQCTECGYIDYWA